MVRAEQSAIECRLAPRDDLLERGKLSDPIRVETGASVFSTDDGRFDRYGSSRATGKYNRIRVPLPGALATSIPPLCDAIVP